MKGSLLPRSVRACRRWPLLSLPWNKKFGTTFRKRNKKIDYSAILQHKKGDAMDCNVWHKFPTDLIEGVLTNLPYSSILKFRFVCKSWNRLLLGLIRKQESDKPWFVSGMVVGNKLAYYRPLSSLKKWHFPTLPSLNSPYTKLFEFEPVGSTGGLVCLGKKSATLRSHKPDVICDLFIWNPLTNDCKQLPKLVRPRDSRAMPRPRFAGMYVNYSKNEYKLITTDKDTFTGDLITQMYSSSTNAWKICDSPFPFKEIRYLYSSMESICSNSSVYSMQQFWCTDPRPLSILAFEMTTEVWRVIEAPMEGLDLYIGNLLELHNKVYLIARTNERNNIIRIWRLLEHEDGRGQWILEHQLPDDLSAYLWEKRRLWRCMGNGDLLFFKIWGRRELLIYRILERSWSCKIPDCYLERIGNRHERESTFDGPLTLSPGRMTP